MRHRTGRLFRSQFRIGAATAAPQAGLSDSLIQTLGQWSLLVLYTDTTGAVGCSDSYDTATMISARLKGRYQNISVKSVSGSGVALLFSKILVLLLL